LRVAVPTLPHWRWSQLTVAVAVAVVSMLDQPYSAAQVGPTGLRQAIELVNPAPHQHRPDLREMLDARQA